MKYISILLVFSILLSGCMTKKQTEESNNRPIPFNASQEIDATSQANYKDHENNPKDQPTSETKPNLCAFIYSGNDNADGFIITEYPVSELNTDILIAKMIEINTLSSETKVLSEKMNGTCLHLDLNSSFKDTINSMGSSGEYILMGSLVNTLIHNYQDTVQSVLITVDGETLETGHVIYDFEMTYFE